MTAPLNRIDRLREIGAERIGVDEALELWLDLASTVGLNGRLPVAPVTLLRYRNIVERHLRPVLGTATLAEVDARFVARLRDEVLERSTRPMAQRSLHCLHSCLEECRVLGLIDGNPATGLMIGLAGRRKPQIVLPSRKEARAMLRAADRLVEMGDRRRRAAWARYRPIVYLLRFTGMRVSEILGLPWTAVDTDERQIRVLQSCNEFREIVAPKSAAARRTIDIAPALAELLVAWRARCPESPGSLVFPMPDGRPQKYTSFAICAWPPLSREAGLLGPDGKPRFNRHAFRHLFASELIEKGATLKELQVVIGHASADFTLRYYGHLLREQETLERRRERVRRIAEENWP